MTEPMKCYPNTTNSSDLGYYKVTNENENHHSFQYHDGLNILTGSFNGNVNNSCCKGGLYFTTSNNIYKFIGYGVHIREITLSTDDPSFKMVQNKSGDKYRSNMIILGKKYNMFDIETILQFKLYLSDKFVNYVSQNGYVNVLEWFNSSGYEFKYSKKSIDRASANGHVNVLEWFKNSGYEFKYSDIAISDASANGHVNVLEWFKNSGYEFKYSESAIDRASPCGHVNVLEWFKNSGYEFKYSKNAIDRASANGHVNVLEWFKNSGYEFKYSKYVIDHASTNGHVNVLEWFKNSGYEFKYYEYAIAYLLRLCNQHDISK